MEAATLQKKKNSINKSKLKKTIKNVLSRPDPIFWPTISDEHAMAVETALCKHKVQVPEFKKLHWKELKSLPKDERPKPPRMQPPHGFLFGISDCFIAIERGQCSSIIIEANVNPQCIVHPVIEACVDAKVPVICLKGLRKLTASNFGIPTTCLGTRNDYIQDVSSNVNELSKNKLPQDKFCLPVNLKVMDDDMSGEPKSEIAMDATDSSSHSLYLYRSNKKSRAFVPPSEVNTEVTKSTFIGQNFIEFPKKQINKKAYSKMTVKKITNNPNRAKAK